MELKGYGERNSTESAFINIIKFSLDPWTLYFIIHAEVLACVCYPLSMLCSGINIRSIM